MRKTLYVSSLILCATFFFQAGFFRAFGQSNQQFSAKAQERITKQVHHELVMIPDSDRFDSNLAFQLNGYDVILLGQVTNPTLKSDAERAVKKVEGVEKVDNRIEVLPASPGDDRLRQQLFNAIYRFGPLQRYGVGANRPIRIIVNRGRVTLEGVVDREADKNMAGMQANSVPGVLSVQNDLMVPAKKK